MNHELNVGVKTFVVHDELNKGREESESVYAHVMASAPVKASWREMGHLGPAHIDICEDGRLVIWYK